MFDIGFFVEVGLTLIIFLISMAWWTSSYTTKIVDRLDKLVATEEEFVSVLEKIHTEQQRAFDSIHQRLERIESEVTYTKAKVLALEAKTKPA